MYKSSYISPIIKNRIPDHVKAQYPKFIEFIDHYYSHLEQDNGFLKELIDFRNNIETNANGSYIDNIIADLGFDPTIELKIPKKDLIHFLREFYLSRGSIRSVEFLFKILYNTDAAVTYPRDVMLSPSSSFFAKNNIIVTDDGGDELLMNRVLGNDVFALTIKGATSGTINNIEEVIVLSLTSRRLFSIVLSDSYEPPRNEPIIITNSITGEFITVNVMKITGFNIIDGGKGYSEGDVLSLTPTEFIKPGIVKVKKVSSGSVDTVNIVNGGTGYSVGQWIKANTSSGYGFSAVISSVGVNGNITSVDIYSGGDGYYSNPTVTIKSTGTNAVLNLSGDNIGKILEVEIVEPYVQKEACNPILTISGGTGAQIDLIDTIYYSPPGKHTFLKGVLSNTGYTTDSFYYQQHSYKLASVVNPVQYKNFVDDLIHPVGQVRFDNWKYESAIQTNSIIINLGYASKQVFSYKFTMPDQVDGQWTLNKWAYGDYGGAMPINNIEYFKTSINFNTPSNTFDDLNLLIVESMIKFDYALDAEITIN